MISKTRLYYGVAILILLSLIITPVLAIEQYNSTTKTDYIHIYESLGISFNATPQWGEPPLNVVFVDNSTGTISAWYWDFGDGNTSVSRNTSHTYVSSGKYPVTLTLTGPIGNSTSAPLYIDVAYLNTTVSATPSEGAAPLDVQFNSTPTGLLPDSYYWIFGDGDTSSEQNPMHTYYTPCVNYTVSHRITNGSIEYWDNSTVITTTLGTMIASFSANTTSGVVPLAVAFTDTSVVSNVTIDSWAWDFGDGNTSALQNPENLFSPIGAYTVSMTITNSTCGSNTTTLSITALPAVVYPTNISYNFVLNQNYPIIIRVKDAETLALIDGVEATTDDIAENTLTNGILSQTLEYGSHTFRFEKDGYATTTTSLFVASNATYTVLMSPLAGAGSQNLNVLYPHETTFTLTDLYGNRLPNITVTAQMTGTSVRGNWWNTLYGISTSISPVFNSTTMSSATDTYGKVAFPMVSSAVYTMTFSGSQFSGGSITKQITADQLSITLMLPTTSSQMPTFKSSMLNATLYANAALDPTIYLTLAYNDTSLSTTQVTFFVDFPNQTRLYQSVIPSTPTTNQSFTKDYGVMNVRGDAYVWGYYSNTGFGNSSKSQGITMNGPSGSMVDLMTYHSGWD